MAAKRAKLKAVEPEPGRFILPSGCKPSAATSPDGTRPVLSYGRIQRHAGALWLLCTDSYMATAIELGDTVREGWVPREVLKLAERNKPVFQVDERTWSAYGDGYTKTTYTADIPDGTTFPAVVDVFGGILLDPKDAEPSVFGINPDLMARLAKAIGGGAPFRVRSYGPTKPLHISVEHANPRRMAILMPVRLFDADAMGRAA